MTQDSPPDGVAFHRSGEGKLGPLVRAHDWGRTPIGPMGRWPTTLQGYVSMILAMPTPAIIFWGPEQTQIYNDGYAIIMGPRHPQHLGSSYRTCWPDTYPTIIPWMRRVLDHGEVVTVDRTLIPLTRHGYVEEAYFTFFFSPLRDDGGRIGGLLQLVTEMTGTVLAERRLATLRALAPGQRAAGAGPRDVVRALAANADDVRFVVLWADDHHAPLRAGLDEKADLSVLENVRARVLAENLPVEIDGVQSILPHAPVAPIAEPTQRAVALPIRRSFDERPRGVLIVGVSPRLAFDANYRAFLEGVARETAVAFAWDDEQRARAALALEKNRLQAVLTQLPEGVIIAAANGKLVLRNHKIEELLRGFHPCADISAYEQYKGFHADGRPYSAHEWPLARSLTTGEVVHGEEIRMELLDGSHAVHAISSAPIHDEDGKIVAGVVLHHDITDIKRTEEALRNAVNARDEFLSIASHELKTPLTSLRLQVELARRQVQRAAAESTRNAAPERALDTALRHTDRLIALINDLLDVSRVAAGKLTFVMEPTRLDLVVEELVERFAQQFDAARTALTIVATEPVTVLCDRFRIEQVVTNLLVNALRYGERTPVEVSVAHDGGARIIVRDHGPGIPVDKRQVIFERFARLATSNVAGLGLGLYIARTIAVAHGGTLDVTDAPDGGAQFTLHLPASPP